MTSSRSGDAGMAAVSVEPVTAPERPGRRVDYYAVLSIVPDRDDAAVGGLCGRRSWNRRLDPARPGHRAPLAGRRCDQTLAAPALDLPRDPDFETTAARVLDLYARRWQGHPLGPDDYVISADEKSSCRPQRRHRGRPPRPGRTRRVEFDYRRGGTLAYFAAYDVHRAQVLGRIAPTTGIEPFTDLVAEVMTTEPYASARRVFWVVDNGSSHNGHRSIERMQDAMADRDPGAPTDTRLLAKPGGDLLSILQRKAISPNDFADLDQLAEHFIAFRTATTQPRHRSTGPTPETTSTRSSTASTSTTHRMLEHTPHNPRRTYDHDHSLVADPAWPARRECAATTSI